tara:strand:- start:6916 stop:7140 length:225 start_codon:yes stop_codon:yes gene_type:complete
VVKIPHKGKMLLAKDISQKGRYKIYQTQNMPRVRLLSEKQVKQVNKYLNSPARLQRKRQDLLEAKDILNTLGYK